MLLVCIFWNSRACFKSRHSFISEATSFDALSYFDFSSTDPHSACLQIANTKRSKIPQYRSLTIIHPLMYSRLPNWLVDHFLKQLPYITQGLSETPCPSQNSPYIGPILLKRQHPSFLKPDASVACRFSICDTIANGKNGPIGSVLDADRGYRRGTIAYRSVFVVIDMLTQIVLLSFQQIILFLPTAMLGQ